MRMRSIQNKTIPARYGLVRQIQNEIARTIPKSMGGFPLYLKEVSIGLQIKHIFIL